MRVYRLAVASLLIVACESKPAANPPAADSGVAAARNIPSPDTACAKDDDCATFSDDVAGATACCPGCTWHGASKAGLARFHDACAKQPAPMCPPIGCAMPNVVARCAGGVCTAATATQPTVPAPTAACDFWGGRGFSVHTSSYGARGDQFRKLDYDDKTRVVAIDDSEIYPDGKTEAKKPRVTKKSRTLSQPEADALAAELGALCPTPAERAAQCAPGGCNQLDVKTAAGATAHAGIVSADPGVVAKTMKRLAAFFPEVRQD